MHARNIIVLCTICFFAGCLATIIFFTRSARAQDTRIAELQRTAEERQREDQRTIDQLTERYNSLVKSQSAARELVETMGGQLATDSINLNDAADILNTLQETLTNLRNMYSSSPSDRNDNTGVNK